MPRTFRKMTWSRNKMSTDDPLPKPSLEEDRPVFSFTIAGKLPALSGREFFSQESLHLANFTIHKRFRYRRAASFVNLQRGSVFQRRRRRRRSGIYDRRTARYAVQLRKPPHDFLMQPPIGQFPPTFYRSRRDRVTDQSTAPLADRLFIPSRSLATACFDSFTISIATKSCLLANALSNALWEFSKKIFFFYNFLSIAKSHSRCINLKLKV